MCTQTHTYSGYECFSSAFTSWQIGDLQSIHACTCSFVLPNKMDSVVCWVYTAHTHTHTTVYFSELTTGSFGWFQIRDNGPQAAGRRKSLLSRTGCWGKIHFCFHTPFPMSLIRSGVAVEGYNVKWVLFWRSFSCIIPQILLGDYVRMLRFARQ